jgi:hypothetical protein
VDQRLHEDTSDSRPERKRESRGGDPLRVGPISSMTPASLASLQRLVGNRAAIALIAPQLTVQRDGAGTGTEAPPAPPRQTDEEKRVERLETSYAKAVVDKNWRQVARDLNGFNDTDIATKVVLMLHEQLIEVDSEARQTMIGWHERVTGAIAKFDAEADRVGDLSAKYETAIKGSQWDEAVVNLNGFNDIDIISKLNKLSPDQLKHMGSAAKNTKVGGGRMARYVNAVAGVEVKSQADEQVGGSVYTVQGRYTYALTTTAIRVSVGMNFKPDSGVTVPVGTWFGYIRDTWNHFSAVNQANRAEKYAIEFVPTAGPGHDIQVSDHSEDGNNRANAGHYYIQDNRLTKSVPHEFGHLIGLEDEYERDAADYQRVAGESAPAGSGEVPLATTIATGIHEALFDSEKLFEWHRTAERRRMTAVNKVLADNHIVANYQSGRKPLTREVSIQYMAKYGHEMSVDFRSRVDTNEDEFNNWREQVLGTFQVTSSSIMGDMTADHEHAVQPRHVRAFARYIQQILGRGNWVPEQDH